MLLDQSVRCRPRPGCEKSKVPVCAAAQGQEPGSALPRSQQGGAPRSECAPGRYASGSPVAQLDGQVCCRPPGLPQRTCLYVAVHRGSCCAGCVTKRDLSADVSQRVLCKLPLHKVVLKSARRSGSLRQRSGVRARRCRGALCRARVRPRTRRQPRRAPTRPPPCRPTAALPWSRPGPCPAPSSARRTPG